MTSHRCPKYTSTTAPNSRLRSPRYTEKVSASTESGTIAVLAEKPSVARDIARVLGAASRGDGYLHDNGCVIIWAIGHLAVLAQPHEIQAEWKH